MASATLERRGCVEEVPFVNDRMARQFLGIYRAAFAPLETLAPARQGLTDDEFLTQMEDPSVVKFVAWDDAGNAAALAFMATDLSAVPWISPPYFQARFPEHYARRAVFYFGALLVSPDQQGGRWASLVLDAAVRIIADARGIAVFDCCDHNVSRKLPELIARVARKFIVLEAQELEAQHYFAYMARE